MNKILPFINNNILKLLFVCAISISVISFIYYFQSGLITAYGDSKGHLNIARRVVDSQTPGAAQFGGYWMPLLHIFMLPTIWNDFFWQIGISGSIPNMIAYVLAVIFIFKLVLLASKSKFSAIIASVIIMLNPNLIYMQTTPMTESLFIGTLVIFFYYFYRWVLYRKETDLILSALFLVLCSINRYEAWLTVLASSFLLLINWVVNKFNKKAEGAFFLFSMLAWLGIFGWLLWGAVIFGDPLEFMHNELSAGNQTKVAYSELKPVGDGNIAEAILTNVFSIKHTTGYILLFLSAFAFILYIIKNFKNLLQAKTLFLFITLTPFVFDVITVYIGNVPVEVPELSKLNYPSNYFNIRYSLYSLPAIAFFVSMISKRIYVLASILILVLLNYFLLLPYGTHKIVTLRDAGALAATYDLKGLQWLKKNYNDGLILASTGSLDGFMHDSGIPQKKYILEGSYKIWGRSIDNPDLYADWIIISYGNKRDGLYNKLNMSKVKEDFEIAYENQGFYIFKRKK